MYATIAGRKVHLVQSGSGPVAVLVHGFPLDAGLWLDQVAGLADVRTVVAVDLRGCGGSGPIGDERLSMEALASDLDLLADHLGADTIDLAGLSMGGYVALAFADLFGHRLRSLALLNTKATADGEEARANRDAAAERVVVGGRAHFAEDLAAVLLGPNASLTARARLRSMVEGSRYETIVASLAAMRDRPDRSGILGTVDVPALVVAGEHDRLAPPEEAAALSRALPRGDLVVVPNAGHLTPIEAPEMVTEALRGLYHRSQ